ncbi:MAG: DUF2267 domain-containing protein [Myxococcaceae bacterium]|nr:DUF2267 domain-containing protein [Myxococcaceae bacterium]
MASSERGGRGQPLTGFLFGAVTLPEWLDLAISFRGGGLLHQTRTTSAARPILMVTDGRQRGLVFYDEGALRAALATLEQQQVDSDGDGIPDITELREGEDPNRKPGAPGEVPLLEPRYGCSSAGGDVAIVALLAVVALISGSGDDTRRRRRSLPGRTGKPGARTHVQVGGRSACLEGRMTHAELILRVADRTGLASTEDAARTVRIVLEAIGPLLRWADREALAGDLPAPLTERLRSVDHTETLDLAQLYARIAGREGVHPGFAVEHTGVVCQVLAEALSPGTLHRLRDALPEAVSALFVPRELEEHVEHVDVDSRHHTLAEGRPGSRHPLSEARPERAQTHSVVRADNPHGDTKLSSATGLTQEREHETLANGRSGSSRPLYDADE